MIVVIPTGGANLNSVLIAIERSGKPFKLSESPSEIASASHVILPGVGFAKTAMESLHNKGLVEPIRKATQPVLGICLGMQILFESSAEGDAECLGILPGKVKHFPRNISLTVPHMGWNRLQSNSLFQGKEILSLKDADCYCYFVHSFVAPMGEWVESYATYGIEVPAIVNKDNFFGMQFHPERSGACGQNLIERFLEL